MMNWPLADAFMLSLPLGAVCQCYCHNPALSRILGGPKSQNGTPASKNEERRTPPYGTGRRVPAQASLDHRSGKGDGGRHIAAQEAGTFTCGERDVTKANMMNNAADFVNPSTVAPFVDSTTAAATTRVTMDGVYLL